MSEATRYRVPARVHRVEQTVRRSRFVTTAAHAPDPEAAHALVERVREELPDATHHCWAFVAGPPGDTSHVGMSDAGEPHGTAGRPMLHALLHGGVGEIGVVCTRYFGGVKLGTGGLSRAYAGAVLHVLDSLPTRERVDRVKLGVTLDYSEVDGFKRLASGTDVLIAEEEYGENVRFVCAVPATELPTFREAVARLTQGRARLEER